MRNRLALLVVIGVALCGAYLRAQFGNQPSKLNTVKLKDDLFVIHNDYVPGNTTALITNEGVVLVDDKFPVDYQNILAELKKVTSQPVKYVINTHHHGDHSGSNASFQMAGAIAIATEQARENMVDGKQPGPPTITFRGRGFVHLGGKDVLLYQFGRAHTNGDLVALFPAQRVLAAGDMFTYGDATPELVDYAGGGSAKEWPATLDGALQLDFDTVVPGHGEVTTKAEMRKARDSAQSLRNKVHDMIVQKKTKAEIEKMLRADFHFADLHIQRSLDGLLVELQ